MFFVVSTLYIALIQGSTPQRLRVQASGDGPFWPNFGPDFVLFQEIEFWYTLNCVEPLLSWLKKKMA